MTVHDQYDYLIKARRDLWAALEAVPEDLLGQSLIKGSRFDSIKDLLFHIAEVEDGWIQGDLQGKAMLQEQFPTLRATDGGPVYAAFALADLVEYWRAVEQTTLAYLRTLTDADLLRVVELEESRARVDQILFHVMQHEIRHTAQICVLLRTQGIKPPSLDLYFYFERRQPN